MNLDVEYIHTGPIIRKEGIFDNYSLDERRALIYKIFNFAFKSPVHYYTISIKRKEATDRVQLSGKIGKAINAMLNEHWDYIDSFDNVIVYYDNGQRELGSILNAVFSIRLSNVEFRKADPGEYRLSEMAAVVDDDGTVRFTLEDALVGTEFVLVRVNIESMHLPS